jgi:hypothetical protein
MECVAQVVVGRGIFRFEFHGSLEAGHRLVQFSLGPKSVAQVTMERSVASVRFDRPAKILDSQLGLTHLQGDNAQEIQCIGMIRIHCQDLPVNLLSSLKFPRLMLPDGIRKCFSDSGH